MRTQERFSNNFSIEPLESRQLLSGEPWGFFPQMIGQDSAAYNYPQLTGKGLTVAVVDSAVDYMQPILGGGFGPGFKISTGYNFVDRNGNVNIDQPSVNSAHATGVVGVLAADPYIFRGKRYQGIAPLVNVIVLRQDTSAHARDALQWVVNNRTKYNIVAVNLTDFYDPLYYNASLYRTQTAQLAAAGVFIAAPGGNVGATVPVSVSSPASDPNVFGTTGIDRNGAIVSYFQRDTDIDELGPGKGVTLPYYELTTQTRFITDYGEGSSWSTPHITGTALLLKQINPNFTPAQIAQIIKKSGVPTFDPVSRLTFSRINVEGALQLGYESLLKATPWGGGAPLSLPGIIQAENFDYGGSKVGYRDMTAGNAGGQARRAENVDIEQCADAGGGYDVGWTQAGEWLSYTTNVRATGNYRLGIRVASAIPGGTFHINVDGVNVTGTMTMPNTGGWKTFATITSKRVSLLAGVHKIRLVFDSNGSNGYVGNVNYLQLTPYAAAAPKPAMVMATVAAGRTAAPAISPSIAAGSTMSLVLGHDDKSMLA